MRDSENEGVWKWDDGYGRALQWNSLLEKWPYWRGGEPNNAPKHSDIEEDCASVSYDGVSDVNCETEKKTVLCVKRRTGKC